MLLGIITYYNKTPKFLVKFISFVPVLLTAIYLVLVTAIVLPLAVAVSLVIVPLLYVLWRAKQNRFNPVFLRIMYPFELIGLTIVNAPKIVAIVAAAPKKLSTLKIKRTQMSEVKVNRSKGMIVALKILAILGIAGVAAYLVVVAAVVLPLAMGLCIMGSIVNTVKYSAKVERPDGSSRNSFPSGHTANSFMNATFVHKEYGQYRHPLYSVAAYTAATATAIGRQLNNRHWISDVLAGAGIGILSTELGYFFADKMFKEHGEHPPLGFNRFPVDKRPSFIEMRMGIGIAISKDLTAKRDDIFAKRGFNMGIEGAWFFHKHFGIGGEFAFTSFPMNSDNLQFSDPDIATISDGYYTQPMGIRYLSLGPFFSIPLPHNWFITAKLTAGTSMGAQGNVLLQLRDDFKDFFNAADLPYLRYKPEKASCLTAGMGIQKRIGRNTALKLFASYFDSNHDFDLDILTEVDAEGNYIYQNLGSEKVRFDNVTFGLALTAFIW